VGRVAPRGHYSARRKRAAALLPLRPGHSFKLGADIRRVRFDRQTGGVFNGRYFFGAIYTSNPQAPNSGAPLADFLLGLPSLIEGEQQLDWTRLRQIYAGAFFQDDWKATRRLTVNWGLRYDLYTALVDARDRGSLFDVTAARFARPGQDGYSQGVIGGDHNNFGPPWGLAFQWRPRIVIRSGYGIYFGDSDRNASSHLHGSQIPNVPILTAPPVDALRTVTPPYTVSTPIQIAAFNPDLSTPSCDRINLQQLPFEFALHGRNTQANRRYPFINFINGLFAYDQSTATSNYNSVNFKVERRLSAGLTFLVNYSIQKTLERGVPGVIGTFTQNGGTSLPLDSFFNPAAFSAPLAVTSSTGARIQTYGNSAKRVARGPGLANWDAGLFKNTNVREGVNVQFRAEFFNLFNTPHFGLASAASPSLTFGNPAFGKLVTSAELGRQIQFGLKFVF